MKCCQNTQTNNLWHWLTASPRRGLTIILDYNQDRTLHQNKSQVTEQKTFTNELFNDEPLDEALIYIESISRNLSRNDLFWFFFTCSSYKTVWGWKLSTGRNQRDQDDGLLLQPGGGDHPLPAEGEQGGLWEQTVHGQSPHQLPLSALLADRLHSRTSITQEHKNSQ